MHKIKRKSKTIKSAIFILCMAFLSNPLFSQTLTQTVKGKVLDTETDSPLPGAYISMIGSETTHSAISNMNGDFRIENVTVGRASFKIGFMGYEEFLA
ncbi:MAG: hypothetical protein ACI8XB_003104 [Patiriisocius sp.]|jgi:hypothetical protein